MLARRDIQPDEIRVLVELVDAFSAELHNCAVEMLGEENVTSAAKDVMCGVEFVGLQQRTDFVLVFNPDEFVATGLHGEGVEVGKVLVVGDVHNL